MTARRLLLSALICCLGPLCGSAVLPAQQAPPFTLNPLASPIAGFPVTGRVVCADTQHAARFAQVLLIPASTGAGEGDRGRAASGRTDLDGHFVLENVPPGEYFATAELIGYVNDGPAIRNAVNQGGDALAALAGVARVQVSNGGATVQVSLQRGAVISGTATWDDGSPAAGLAVGVQAPPANGASAATGGLSSSTGGLGRGQPFGGFGRGSATDDRGRFRLNGLAAGSYIVQVYVQSPLPQNGGSSRFERTVNLNVYAPGKFRRSEATAVTLAAGEERSDVNLVLNLNGLHTLSGQVSASSVSVRGGSVLLTDQSDASLVRRGMIGSDGSFSVAYVPPGNYTLRVNATSQGNTSGRGEGSADSVRFQPISESVTVSDSDLSGLALTVTPATAAAQ